MEEIALKSRKNATKCQTSQREKQKNESEYVEIRTKRNKIYYDKVNEISPDSANIYQEKKKTQKKKKSRSS